MKELRSYQKEGVKEFALRTRQGKSGLIFDVDAGLGKTLMACTISNILQKKNANILYVTRKSLDLQVVDEAKELGMKVVRFKGSVESKLDQLLGVEKRSGTFALLTTGSFRDRKRSKDRVFWAKLAEIFDLLIVDEVQDFKNPDTNQSRSLLAFAKNIPLRLPMSGTLMGNSEVDYFVPASIADPSVFGDNFKRFRDTYFREITIKRKKTKIDDPDRTFKKYEIREWLKEDFNTKLNSLRFVAREKEVKDLPPLIKQMHRVEMNDKEARMLKQLQKEFVTYLDTTDEQITAMSVMAQSVRLRQLCSAVIPLVDDKGEVTEHFDNEHSKVEWLLDFLDELMVVDGRKILPHSPKIIIWANFRTAVFGIRDLIEQKYRTRCSVIIGGQSEVSREQEKNLFKNDPDCHFLVATPGAGGVGLNLQEAKRSIFFSKNYSQMNDHQAQKRSHRIGSEKYHDVVYRHDVVMSGSIEESIEKNLDGKRGLIEAMEQWRLEWKMQLAGSAQGNQNSSES